MSLKRNSLLAIELVTFSHTLFVLPLIFSGYLIVTKDFILIEIILLLIAAISARTIGMLFNRMIDKKIDFANPRTSSRLIPSNKVSNLFVYTFLILSIFIYFISCFLICNFIFFLSPIPIILFFVYPYTKRFTWLCHFFLGLTLSFGPIAGGLVSTCDIQGFYSVLPIGIFTFLWISGFDILYALQDHKHDVKNKIFSIPSRFGTKTGIKISLFCFSLSIMTLIYYAFSFKNNLLSFVIITIISINFIFQIVNSFKNNYYFFKYNSYIGILILLLIISDILII